MVQQQIDRNKTTINLNGSHQFKKINYCGYCKGNRQTMDGIEEGLQNVVMGFKTCKIKVDDYELLLDKGFCLCGTYARLNDQTKACCEVYQYKVKMLDFKLNKN